MISIRKAGTAALASACCSSCPQPRSRTAATTAARWGSGRSWAGRGYGRRAVAHREQAALRRAGDGPCTGPRRRRRARCCGRRAGRRHASSDVGRTKSVGRRVSSGDAGGPAAAAALARTQGHVVDGTVGLFDGAPDPIVAADAATLKAALDGRDALVAGILALTDHSGYGFALGTIARDAASEAQDIAETLTDDTLTDAAKAALTAAQAQATATATAAQAGAGTSGATGRERDAGFGSAERRGGRRRMGARDCPPGGQRRQRR